jgi:hypothetical protein
MPIRRPHEPDRVRRYTSEPQLRAIDAKTRQNVQMYGTQSREEIDRRIEQLRGEWSIERFLQLNVAAVGLTTVLLALMRDRRWGYATCAGLAFFLFHAADGFDPPMPLLRRLGVRTRAEIDRETYALKAMRGDFSHLTHESAGRPDAELAIQAVGA